jgi:lipopolysaccharide heptosyltransferase II
MKENKIKVLLRYLYLIMRMFVLYTFLRVRKKSKIELREDAEILVIRLDRIGDLVLSTPIFKVLDKKYPKARITALVTTYTKDILINNPHIDRILVSDNISKTIKENKNKYDLIFDLFMDYEIKTAMVTRLMNPKYSIGYDAGYRGVLFTNPVKKIQERKHFVDYLFGLLAPLDIVPDKTDKEPEIFLDDKCQEEYNSWMVKNGIGKDDLTVSMHISGFYPVQRWPWNNYCQLIENMTSKYKNIRVYIFAKKEEEILVNHIMKTINPSKGHNNYYFIGQNLLNVICIIKNTKLFIGNNSGLLHIAAALKTPTISFMGSTVPWTWSPYGDKEKNIVLRKGYDCSPCSKGSCSGHKCLNDITVQETFDTATKMLEKLYGIK